jgi:hypothetical protein
MQPRRELLHCGFLRPFSAAIIVLQKSILNQIIKEKTTHDNQTGTYQ